MKRTLLVMSLLLILIASLISVPRNKVIIEIGTGTWCQFCLLYSYPLHLNCLS